MRVTVVGAGIVGVCTAWALVEAGCEVTVVERNSGVAQETSYGNAGIVAPAHATPWAAPGMPGKVLSTLWAHDAAFRFAPIVDLAQWRWALRWLGECRAARFERNRERMQRLAFYSRGVLETWRDAHDLSYERTEGLLQLLRGERDVGAAAATVAFLKSRGVAQRLMNAAECRVREPGLSDIQFAGGLLLPDSETGNCALFARQLKTLCERRGAVFEFGESIDRIATDGDRVTLLVRRNRSEVSRSPDAVVIAAGVASAPLLRRLGIRLPLYPVKGYSASVPIREPTYAPIASVIDDAYRVAIVRMGSRIRIAGTGELGDRSLSPATRNAERAFATLLKVARDWFPGAADYQAASWWVGARPMLPDGPPIVGPTRHPRIFANVGHGATGWAMAPGSGRIIAALVTGGEPDIDLDGLTLARYD